MARNTKLVVIPQEEGNRDSGKTFLLTEMSAADTEEWSMQLITLLASTNIDIPGLDTNNLNSQANTAMLAQLGIGAIGKIPFDKAKPLLDKMMTTIVFVPNPQKPQITNAQIDLVIEEVDTLLVLRKEFFILHTGFFKRAARSLFASFQDQRASGGAS